MMKILIGMEGKMSTEIVVRESFMPALTIADAVGRYNELTTFVKTVMREGSDYGAVPGTDKPTLFKPGAEKLCTLFGLSIRFEIVGQVEDWTGEQHGGEPFFYYVYKCRLLRGDSQIAEAEGSCNSWEKKYRWRQSERTCPACGKSTIIKGKAEYGGGWLCFAKKGGCGAKFKTGDSAIEGQSVGQVSNPDIFDIVNTIRKMAQKRAHVAATLIGVNASEFFTQDVEDMAIIEGDFSIEKPEPKAQPQAQKQPVRQLQPPKPAQQKQSVDYFALANVTTAKGTRLGALTLAQLETLAAASATGTPEAKQLVPFYQSKQSEHFTLVTHAHELGLGNPEYVDGLTLDNLVEAVNDLQDLINMSGEVNEGDLDPVTTGDLPDGD